MLRSVLSRAPPAWRAMAATPRSCAFGASRVRFMSNEAADGSEPAALSDTATRSHIHSAFSQRAADALRYEYFAQRAELEAEVEAAHMFRSLVESCKQQAMGFMELMEEYDDAEFGSTLNNLEMMADSERALQQVQFKDAASVAQQEDLTHIQEWFEDLSDASARAANRLEFTATMLDSEALEGDEDVDDDEHDGEHDVDTQAPPSKK